MSYVTRTKDDPGYVGRAADQQQSIDNEEFLKNIIEGDHLVRRIITKTSIADNAVTEIFTITTVNEAGNEDAGVWAVKLHGAVVHGDCDATELHLAVKGFGAQFCRAMGNTGTGNSSAVTENLETASAASTPASNEVAAVSLTLAETSEYITSVRIQVDLTGTALEVAEVYFVVELVFHADMVTVKTAVEEEVARIYGGQH